MNPASNVSQRVSVIRLGPIDSHAAMRLLVAPMDALGVRYESQASVHRIVDRTGGLPFMLQFYGHGLVDALVDAGLDTVSEEMVRAFEDQLATKNVILGPLLGLNSPRLRALATQMLKSGEAVFSLARVSEIAASIGDSLTPEEAWNTCYDLCVSGILSFVDNRFGLAVPALREVTRELGYFE